MCPNPDRKFFQFVATSEARGSCDKRFLRDTLRCKVNWKGPWPAGGGDPHAQLLSRCEEKMRGESSEPLVGEFSRSRRVFWAAPKKSPARKCVWRLVSGVWRQRHECKKMQHKALRFAFSPGLAPRPQTRGLFLGEPQKKAPFLAPKKAKKVPVGNPIWLAGRPAAARRCCVRRRHARVVDRRPRSRRPRLGRLRSAGRGRSCALAAGCSGW